MSLAPGTSFVGYTVVRMTSTSAMGEVYLAQRRRRQRRYALKILPAAATDDSEFLVRFRQEAKVATSLRHPHIVRVYDRGEWADRPWTAMEYVDAIDVAELMLDRFPAGMPPGEAVRIITAMAEALDCAHQRGMLHRDVQPARMLVTHAGADGQRVLLTDFGIAGQCDDADMRPYAAPEQLTGSDIDGRTDQYGLAASAFHLLTGTPPYPDPDPAAATARAKVSDRRADLARFDNVFSTAFADDPADRFADCLEFAQALTAQAASSLGEPTPEAALTLDYPGEAVDSAKVGSGDHVHAPGWSTPRRRLPVAIAIGAGLILCISLLAVGVFIGRKHGTTSTDAESPGTGRTTGSAAPPLVVLDGTYRLDLDREKQTYDQTPDPQPPNVTTWWAFRSSCTPTGCLASGVLLDDVNHQKPNPATGVVVLDLRSDTWQSRPETAKFPCKAKDGTAATETILQALWLQPKTQSSLRGTMTVTVQTDDCGQIGGRIVIPATVTRVSDAPPGIDVPGPTPMTTPTR